MNRLQSGFLLFESGKPAAVMGKLGEFNLQVNEVRFALNLRIITRNTPK